MQAHGDEINPGNCPVLRHLIQPYGAFINVLLIMHSIKIGLKFTYVMVYSVKKDLRRLVLLQMAILVADCIVLPWSCNSSIVFTKLCTLNVRIVNALVESTENFETEPDSENLFLKPSL